MQFRCQMELESITETSVNMFLFLVEFFPSNGMTQKATTKYVTKKSNVIKEKNYICLIIVFLAKSFTFYCGRQRSLKKHYLLQFIKFLLQ